MISSRQIRAARALLGISQPELAERAGVGVATLRRIEAARDVIVGNARTLERIGAALGDAGIIIIDQSDGFGEGVRLRRTTSQRQP